MGGLLVAIAMYYFFLKKILTTEGTENTENTEVLYVNHEAHEEKYQCMAFYENHSKKTVIASVEWQCTIDQYCRTV
jgi:hypothetical protein